ncbi:MAG: addiction module protein [Akkermansiaceae bacterium]|nr:addiction module protein [Akkermansiaceae bacterium]MCP5548197.1 addiction module protein [Akkermansiaceae bacterium]
MEAVIIEKEALQLPDIERAVLADRLLASLSHTPAELEDAWIREAESRLAGFRKGEIEAVSGPDAMAELRKRFPR